MPSIRFSFNPAYISIGQGIGVAAAYWRETWTLWILPVAAIVLVTGLAQIAFGVTEVDPRLFSAVSPGRAYEFPTLTPAQIAGPLAINLVALVATWFIMGIAMAGIRRRAIDLSWVLWSGLRTIGAALLAGFVVALAMVPIIGLAMVAPITMLSLFLIVPACMYAAIRLSFWDYAIFDGMGVMDAARFSWRIGQDSVLRIFGWSLMSGLLGLLVGAGAATITFVFSLMGLSSIGTLITTAATEGVSVFATILVVVLYESQRWRYAPPAMPPMPAPSNAPDEYGSPLDPPPPPAAPPSSPWS